MGSPWGGVEVTAPCLPCRWLPQAPWREQLLFLQAGATRRTCRQVSAGPGTLCLRSLEARLEHPRRPPVWTGVGQWCCVGGGWEWGDQSGGLKGGGESCERGPQGGSAGGWECRRMRLGLGLTRSCSGDLGYLLARECGVGLAGRPLLPELWAQWSCVWGLQPGWPWLPQRSSGRPAGPREGVLGEPVGMARTILG